MRIATLALVVALGIALSMMVASGLDGGTGFFSTFLDGFARRPDTVATSSSGIEQQQDQALLPVPGGTFRGPTGQPTMRGPAGNPPQE